MARAAGGAAVALGNTRLAVQLFSKYQPVKFVNVAAVKIISVNVVMLAKPVSELILRAETMIWSCA